MPLPLSGYKTYLAAIGFVLLSAADFLYGSGSIDFESLLMALGLAGVRSAIGELE